MTFDIKVIEEFAERLYGEAMTEKASRSEPKSAGTPEMPAPPTTPPPEIADKVVVLPTFLEGTKPVAAKVEQLNFRQPPDINQDVSTVADGNLLIAQGHTRVNTLTVVLSGVVFTTTLIFAMYLKRNHSTIIQQLNKYRSRLNQFGPIHWTYVRLNRHGRLAKIYILNEAQAMIMVSVLRSSALVLDFRVALIQSFRSRRSAKLLTPISLPKHEIVPGHEQTPEQSNNGPDSSSTSTKPSTPPASKLESL